MKDLYIIGAGGLGREVSWLIERINAEQETWNLKGFIDDNFEIWNTQVDGYIVLRGTDYLVDLSNDIFVLCAIASPIDRRKIVDKLKLYNHVHFVTAVDPTVQMSKFVKFGDGVIICAGTIITVDVSIGEYSILNPGCTIGHDVSLGSFNTLYPAVNVSGHVNTQAAVEIGTGTQVIQGINIGENALIGAGAVVINDIPGNCTAVGVPARPIKFNC